MTKPSIRKLCLVCKKVFRVYPYRKDTAKYCSHKCYAKSLIGRRQTKKWYKAMIGRTPWNKGKPWPKEVREKMSRAQKKRFQRESIWNKGLKGYRAGEKSHLWKGGISKFTRKKRNNEMITFEYRKWRQKVFERDNYSCKLRGKRGIILNAHHILPYSEFVRFRYSLDNGVTLCKKCHLFILSKEFLYIPTFLNL